MFIVFFVGTAGSGKSLLTASFSEWLRIEKQKVATLNLDPGATRLPYTPDVDVRDYIRVEEIMDKYGLGPNGALILAADLIADEASRLGTELSELNPDIVLVDTPGQMELFAYRNSGLFMASALSQGDYCIVFLVDAMFAERPADFLSALLLSSSIQSRFQAPQINVVSKKDLLSKETLGKVFKWVEEPERLIDELALEEKGMRRELACKLFESLSELGLLSSFFAVSSTTGEGLDELHAELQRVFERGEV